MAESRLQRWSRMKTGASQEAESAPPSTAETELSAEEQELAINEALPEQGVLEKYDLPDPDAIELGTDITGFMRKEIPELLRRKALRALWRSNPVLAVLDGLNDYDEDFSNAATTVNGVQTLYKVGQGMFDKSARANEALNEQSSEQAENQIPSQAEAEKVAEPERVADTASEEASEESAGTSTLGISVEPSHNEHVESVTSGPEEEPAPRYRPRMRFE
jgi:hypothetical protein